MRRPRAMVCAIALWAVAGGCGGTPLDGQAGRLLFTEKGCVDCHTLADAGATAQVGPNLDQAKPSTAEVINQVLRGGNGMPSFEGKLSKQEIQSLAAYVSSAAAKSGTSVAAAFRPDKTKISDCGGDGDAACYQQALGNLVLSDGVKPAMRVVNRELAAARLSPGNCHRVMHFVGAAAVARHRGNVARALGDGSAACASGYYHGVVERGFAGATRAELPERSAQMCADPAVTRRAFEHFQCLHGLGHGLMLQTSYDLPFALRTCDSLGTDFARVSCGGGVFMENFTSSYGVKSRYLRKDDPIYPCNDVPEGHKMSCYQHVTIPILRNVGYDIERGSEICAERSEPDWIRVCFQSLGRDIASVLSRGPRDSLRQCRVAAEYEAECLFGVARYIANDDADVERAADFCLSAPAPHRARCLVGVGVTVSSLQPEPRDRLRTCRRIAGRYREACEKGAGVWSP